MTALQFVKRFVDVPPCEKVVKVYSSAEGDIRVVTENNLGMIFRYRLRISGYGVFALARLD